MKQKQTPAKKLGNAQNIWATTQDGTTTILYSCGDRICKKIFKNGAAKEDKNFSLGATCAVAIAGVLVYSCENIIKVKGEE